MVKFLVVSDNHGSKKELSAITKRHQGEVDLLIHCGDSELSYESEVMSSFLKVRGNCDLDENYPDDKLEHIEGIPVYVTHGHLYNVKMSLMNITFRARELGAKVACFGHSHIAFTEYNQDVLLINPGSIRLPRIHREKTYAICTLDEKEAYVTFYNIDGQRIEGLSKVFQIG